MSPLPDFDAKQEQIKKWVKYGVIGLAAAVTAPIAIYIVDGLIAWGVCALAFLVVANFAPAVGAWFAAKRIQALKTVAAANPIETMQDIYREKAEELKQNERDIAAFETGIRDFESRLKEVVSEYPGEAQDYEDMLAQEKAGLTEMKDQYADSAAQLINLTHQIDKAEMLFDLAKTALRVSQLNKSQSAQVYQDIKKKVAFDTVTSTVNASFAALNASVMARKAARPFAPKSAAPAAIPAPMTVTVEPPEALPPAPAVPTFTSSAGTRRAIPENVRRQQ